MEIIYKIQDWLKSLKWRRQKKRRGWSDPELWNLDYTVSKWIVPRLKAFQAETDGCPPDMEFIDWQLEIREMIFGFEFDGAEWYEKNVFPVYRNPAKDQVEIDKKLKEYKDLCQRALDGRILFAKRFEYLWW